MGTLSVVEKGGIVTGKVTDAKNPCAFPKGTTVLDGSRLDDSVTGSLKACKVGEGCSGAMDGAVMLLVTKGGTQLSGAVHFDGKCKTPIGGDGITLKKAAAKAPKPKETPTTTAPLPAKGRARAEALATEAKKLLESGAEGSIEEARDKLKESVVADPEYAAGWNGIGVTFYLRQRFDEALENYKKSIEADPSIADAYYNVACIYAIKQDPEQAIRYLRISFLNGWTGVDTLAQDPDLKGLEGNPDFEKMKKGQL